MDLEDRLQLQDENELLREQIVSLKLELASLQSALAAREHQLLEFEQEVNLTNQELILLAHELQTVRQTKPLSLAKLLQAIKKFSKNYPLSSAALAALLSEICQISGHSEGLLPNPGLLTGNAKAFNQRYMQLGTQFIASKAHSKHLETQMRASKYQRAAAEPEMAAEPAPEDSGLHPRSELENIDQGSRRA